MSRTMSGRIGPAVCASVEQRNPGENSSVMAAPPVSGRRSRTSGLKPALARKKAVTSPLCPPPTIIALRASAISGGPLRVLQDFQRRQPPVRTHDAAAWMGCRATHVKVLDRGAILRPSRHGTEKEQLFEREFSLKDIAFTQPEFPLQIERCQHLLADD